MKTSECIALSILLASTPALADDWYVSGSTGITRAFDTSNNDRVEFGTEPGYEITLGGGRLTHVDDWTLRTGILGTYAPKALHGDNSGSEHKSADGKTYQAGSVGVDGTAIYKPDAWPIGVLAGATAGPGITEDGAKMAGHVRTGIEYPISANVSADATIGYSIIGDYDYASTGIGLTYHW